jgi:RimJ/RimL family protein N-acetyltransferase
MIRLETERLILGPWDERHFDAYAAFYADEEVSRWVGGPRARNDAWRHLAAQIGHWALRGYGHFCLEEKATGRFAGAVGPWFPDGWPELELGYWLVRDMHGKGYATEAGRECQRFVFEDLGAKTLVSYIRHDNVASQRVAERLGGRYGEVAELPDRGEHRVYRYPASARP